MMLFLATSIFYVSGTCELLSFFALAPKYPKLIRLWESIERTLPTFQNEKQKNIFIFKIRLLIGIITIFAIGIFVFQIDIEQKSQVVGLINFS